MMAKSFPSRLLRAVAITALAGATLVPLPLRAADPAPFDLPGPGLRISVSRGEVTLPIDQVPSLAEGDRLTIRADFPEDQRARFLLVSTFLQGATNPPPKDWIRTAEPWRKKEKDRQLDLVVPKGARQLVLFLVPASGGASGAIADAVRGRPGEFVRASQDLNQASLDRARLDGFMAAIRAQENSHPEYLRSVAPTLARSLSMKLNEECLGKVIELQAACLLEHRDTLVLADVHTSSLTETLSGAPVDLAMQLSSTREAGMGYYSPYIGVIRDIARVFGAFSNPQLDYLPSLSLRHGEGVSLLLNAAPSFDKPRSVLVTAMPAIEANSPPRLRAAVDGPLCGARPGLVLPVDGAPLIYATDYLHGATLRLTAGSRTIELPLVPRADRGGYVVAGAMPADLKGKVDAQILGRWGFDRFEGPRFALQFPAEGDWAAAGGVSSLVTRRDNPVALTGPAPACVTSVAMRTGSGPQPLAAKLNDDGDVAVIVPLKDSRPGEVVLEIRQQGVAEPATVSLRARAQASRLDGLAIHAGDRSALLSGQRLDQVARVELSGLALLPAGLTRDGDVDRLQLDAEGTGEGIAPGSPTARITLQDGRVLNLPVTVAEPRPGVTLIERSLAPKQARRGLVLETKAKALLPDSARLVFSLRAAEGTRLSPADSIEVATADGEAHATLTSGPDLRFQGRDVLVATLDPAALGPSAFGPLRFRLHHGDVTSGWQPLAVLARLPTITRVQCDKGAARCRMEGEGLFLIDSIAPASGSAQPVRVPEGFTGASLKVPAPQGGRLQLRLRDAPDEPVVLVIG
ncbi:hypothetical protein Swit_1046 [Rhizorhabdus wittichii RW1]|uniref:Uncharacterized protein n=1 Tax=Rhizorhabdus wittichii (strain DSM 6014 / CCUG 31198 / JCM 15750 / NBRC 105917 / EY 4224 / RW1) TaxID=392499 RepID=A0A9J9LBH1_RHIWR|nr:hypothetical protein Swit_1046 [Rhizorhabdus wittichii RW1]